MFSRLYRSQRQPLTQPSMLLHSCEVLLLSKLRFHSCEALLLSKLRFHSCDVLLVGKVPFHMFTCQFCTLPLSALSRGHHAQPVQIGNDGSLSEHKVVSIGVKPLSLSAFSMAGVPYVFAATDRPAVVYARNGKLVYSPVNEQDVTMLCSFSTDAFPGAIAMAKDDCLMIAQIDAIQKLHIRCALLSQRCCFLCSPSLCRVLWRGSIGEGRMHPMTGGRRANCAP